MDPDLTSPMLSTAAPARAQNTSEHSLCFSQTKRALCEGIQGNSTRPWSSRVANPHVHCRRPFRAGIHIVSSCGELLGSLSYDTVMKSVGNGLRTNHNGTEAHCCTFPQRWWVYFTVTEKLSGTLRFKISTKILSLRTQWSAQVTWSVRWVSPLWATCPTEAETAIGKQCIIFSLSIHI